jgi:hypothetical protein
VAADVAAANITRLQNFAKEQARGARDAESVITWLGTVFGE